LILDTLPVGMLQTNCYILGCERTREAIVIDPGDEPDGILAALRRHGLTLVCIIGTHGHFDHLLACRVLQEETGAQFYLHHADIPHLVSMRRTCIAWLGYDPGEAPTIDKDLKPGEAIRVGDIVLEVRHTPGHSRGGVTLVDHAGRHAFTGDALFAGSIGRSDLPGGDLNTLLNGIRTEILTLPDDYVVLSGHGERTTVGAERRTNPYLRGSAW
jgi:hydroxyacylglutathione hydrolase